MVEQRRTKKIVKRYEETEEPDESNDYDNEEATSSPRYEEVEEVVVKRTTKPKSPPSFAYVKPFVASVLVVILLAVLAWALNTVNQTSRNYLLDDLYFFIIANLPVFFGVSLLIGYSQYFHQQYPEQYQYAHPLVAGLGLAFFLWFAGWLLRELYKVTHDYMFVTFAGYVDNYSVLAVVLVIVFGYFSVLMHKMFK